MTNISLILLVLQMLPFISFAQDPKLISPNSETVWMVGNREVIAWNASWREPDGKYYNSRTRVTIKLFQKSDFVATIIENFPYSLGSLYWVIPQYIIVDKKENITIELGKDDEKIYSVKVYPTYFDWPDSCNGCYDNAPSSDEFVIKPSNCTGKCEELSPLRPGYGAPGEGIERNYTLAIKSVGIAVGVVALVVFSAALFIYTKRGLKAWKNYQSRRSGHVYKYRAPRRARSKFASSTQAVSPASPLGKFLSSSGDPSPPSNGKDSPPSPVRMDSLAHLTDDRSLGLSAIPEITTVPPSLKWNDLPPESLKDEHPTSSGDEEGGVMFQQEHIQEQQSDEIAPITPQDAMLVGNTFRNVLRVSEQHSPSRRDGETIPDSQSNTLDDANGSPVLSRLDWN